MFYGLAFSGTFQEFLDYMLHNHKNDLWTSVVGDLDVYDFEDLFCGYEGFIEVDVRGNVRCEGDLEILANILS